MTHQEFDALLDTIVDKVRQLGTTKGREYAGGEDRFGNFNRLAARMGITREQVWQVYFTKHLDSLETYIREKGAVTATEPIQGRILDAITYLTLLYGMVEETQAPLSAIAASITTNPNEPHRFVGEQTLCACCARSRLSSYHRADNGLLL